MSPATKPWACGRCTYCGKWAYDSRKEARRARKAYHGSGSGLQVYPCRSLPEGAEQVWHLGHSSPLGSAVA